MANASFGQWLKQRRKALDLTQEELAARVGCSEVMIFKIEADERRPSKQIVTLLAQHLALPPADADAFLKFARSGAMADTTSSLWGTSFHPPNNLPAAPTPLIGRKHDINAARKSLMRDDIQLLTLVGPPGIGKTRLALAVAGEVLDKFSDGVFLVLLAPVSDPELVSQTIVQTLRLQEVGPQTTLERLKSYLRDKQMLLVLDNFEQVLTAAPQIAELLAVCLSIKILVTSRSPLRIRRERQFPVPALVLPDLNQLPTAEALPGYAAVELFIERAQAVKPDFSLTRENGQPVAAICNRLDGLPLAIELISARVKLLSPTLLLERLHGHLLLSSDGLRDIEPRHRTLNAAIGWSYELLDAHEKLLFMRLGVFGGGYTLEAAEIVCQPDMNILDGMASLLDKSLIRQKTGSAGEARFTMLETIREYALERLLESGENWEIHFQHANFFLYWAAPHHDSSLDRIEQEYDNLQTALDWSLANDLGTGMRLAIAVCGYWIQRGRLIEGRFWLEKYIEACQQQTVVTPDDLCTLHSVAGEVAYFQADMDAMRRHSQALYALGREYQHLNISVAFFLEGQIALQQQDFERAKVHFAEALTRSRQAGALAEVASALLMLSLVAAGQKEYERAYTLNTESLALYRQVGDRWGEALILGNTAVIREHEGNYSDALILHCQSLQLSYELRDKRTLSQTLEQISGLMSRNGEHRQAAQLLGAAAALRDSIFAVVEPLDRPHHDGVIEQVRKNLDADAYASAWALGRVMTLEQVMELALSGSLG